MSPEVRQGPINPLEVIEKQVECFPEEVYIVFNGLIAENYRRGRSRVLQKDVVSRLCDLGFERSQIYEKHWLDVEESYESNGWSVIYSAPVAYGGENFDAYFEFKSKQ